MKNRRYRDELQRMSENSLKIFNAEVFRERFRVHRQSFNVLQHFYSSRQFGKRRFLQQRQKQRFCDKFINKTVKICTEAAGGDDYVIAYGDGSFPLAMKGMDGGSLAHKRLMMLFSKRVRIIMTNEYRTTKAYP